MPDLQTFHGHLVDLCRHVNMHWSHRHPFAPTDRCELWLREPDGTERKFAVHTRDKPARCRLAWLVDRAIDLEAWRTAKGPVPRH